MASTVALCLFVAGIASLFFLDRSDPPRPSVALWLPVLWLWINGSRPISVWLGLGPPSEVPGELPASSQLDQLVGGTLMLIGLVVLVRRHRMTLAVLRAGWPIFLYFSFALVSLVWSDFAPWGLKRWFRAIGELAMVMIIVTDAQPIAALKRVLSRVGFVLIPTSVLLIKYYPHLGRGYDAWGAMVNVGVTPAKNSLGVLVYVLALGTVWQIISLLSDRKQPRRSCRLVAQCALLCFCIEIFFSAHSATPAACFVLGAGLMFGSNVLSSRQSSGAVHALVMAVLIVGSLAAFFDAVPLIVNAMGREADFTGRTPIWQLLGGMAPNPFVGAGFETFWVGPRVAYLDQLFRGINQAHNGYLEVYLNLGALGLVLVALMFVHGYYRAAGAVRNDLGLGSLLVAYIVTAITYNMTEAGFRMLSPSWFFLMLAILAASRVTRVSVRHGRRAPGLLCEPALHTATSVGSGVKSWAGLRHSRRMTHPCSPKVTHQDGSILLLVGRYPLLVMRGLAAADDNVAP
jgi:exopolysaccharide production protein ExoQ